MKNIRQIHTYLGTFFAPMILYFSISGAWQVYRWNDLPKEPRPAESSVEIEAKKLKRQATIEANRGTIRGTLNQISLVHRNSTAPGRDPSDSHSSAFDFVAALMSLSLAATTVLGLLLAIRFARSKRAIYFTLAAGVVLPITLLYLV